MSTLATRFWEKVPDQPGFDCWEWGAHVSDGGYGVIKDDGDRNVYAHRVAFALCRGNIPDGMLVCHACDNPSCVNPNHLFIGTHQDNTADAVRKGRTRKGPNYRHVKTHCKRGHEYTADNSYFNPQGFRQCKACRRAFDSERPRYANSKRRAA